MKPEKRVSVQPVAPRRILTVDHRHLNTGFCHQAVGECKTARTRTNNQVIGLDCNFNSHPPVNSGNGCQGADRTSAWTVSGAFTGFVGLETQRPWPRPASCTTSTGRCGLALLGDGDQMNTQPAVSSALRLRVSSGAAFLGIGLSAFDCGGDSE